ncbi:MAG: hypothetical protein EBS53_07620 [Bacteroidetes bacterium]|nr:hypothetical protein [Bacteroidota bacterium]
MRALSSLIFLSFLTLISCEKDDQPDSIQDADGHTYEVVRIGNDEWMASNLRVSKFTNGDPIPLETIDSLWAADSSNPARSFYASSEADAAVFGALYNRSVITDPRGVCPTGWKIPSNADWDRMLADLGGSFLAGNAIRSGENWIDPVYFGSNSSGFNAQPAGTRQSHGQFFGRGEQTAFWSTDTNILSGRQNIYYLGFSNPSPYQMTASKTEGFSIRCIRRP